MRKRTLLSLILLLVAAAAIFADTTVTATLTVSYSNQNQKYTINLTGLDPSNGVTFQYSTNQNSQKYSSLSVNSSKTFNQGVTTVYFKVKQNNNTSSTVSFDLSNNVGSGKTVTLTISSGGSSDGLAEDARLYYFPTSVVNNSNVMVDLTTPKAMTGTEFSDDFVNYTSDNLALFRIRETLMTEKKDTNVVGSMDESITIIIESLDDWTFVNEYNSTRTTSFSLDAFCVEQKWNYTGKGTSYDYTASPTIALTNSSTLTASNASATFTKSGNNYELVLPYTYYSKAQGRYYPRYIMSADVCLNIPEFQPGLEPGYYSTKLRITIPDHDEYDSSENKTSGHGTSFVITVRGFLGIDEGSSGSSSFAVLSIADTYTMDLGIKENPPDGYSVAEAKFIFSDVVASAVGNNTDPRPSNAETKYTIYVSPTSNYTDTSSSFKFIKIGSENQARTEANTIYYTLSWTSNNSSYDNQTTAPLYMRPKYTSTKIASVSTAGTGRNIYQISWEMDNIIKLNLTTESLKAYGSHQEGMYYSYIYFTLVTTT